jgi:trk system potassium uptake protein TrkH
VAGFLAFLLAGMVTFDAVNHILTTVATGGFPTRTASIAAFDSLAVELVAIAFMAISGVNFAFYWQAIRGGSIWPHAAEVRLYMLILVATTGAVTASLVLADEPGGAWRQLRDAGFAVTSVMTTTGYTTADFDEWNPSRASRFSGSCSSAGVPAQRPAG